jgi:hypothetical protein
VSAPLLKNRAADAGAERQNDVEPLPLDDPQSLDLGVVKQAGLLAETTCKSLLQRRAG